MTKRRPPPPPRGTPVHIIYKTSAGEKRTSTGRYVLNSNGQWRAILTGSVWPMHLPIEGWTKEVGND